LPVCSESEQTIFYMDKLGDTIDINKQSDFDSFADPKLVKCNLT